MGAGAPTGASRRNRIRCDTLNLLALRAEIAFDVTFRSCYCFGPTPHLGCDRLNLLARRADMPLLRGCDISNSPVSCAILHLQFDILNLLARRADIALAATVLICWCFAAILHLLQHSIFWQFVPNSHLRRHYFCLARSLTVLSQVPSSLLPTRLSAIDLSRVE